MRIDLNRFRWRQIFVSREYQQVFTKNGKLTRAGEHVLADLRRFAHVDRPTIFDRDAMVMARREGRREMFLRLQRFLNLNEDDVQQLMELDDGR